MSGSSYTGVCPKCKGHLDCYSDYKSGSYEGECFKCGYFEETKIVSSQRTNTELWQRWLDSEYKLDEWEEYVEECNDENKKALPYEEWLEIIFQAEIGI